MRRLWLLPLLAPALAVALPPQPDNGEITWETIVHTDTDGFINLAECASGTITLSWAPVVVATVSNTNVGSFTLYAANKEHGDTCFTGPDPVNAVSAGQVAFIDADLADRTREFSTSDMVSAAGRSCSGTGNEDIYLCMQARNTDGTIFAVSRRAADGTSAAKLVLSRGRPGAPTNLSARPGEQAANVSWSAGGGSIASDTYRVDATPIGTTGEARSSPRITATEHRLGGLVNDQPYTITVTAFSVAGNPNDPATDPSPTTSVTPSHVLDFYSMYRDAGGQEEGGCAGGPAGPVALLAALGALLVARRKTK